MTENQAIFIDATSWIIRVLYFTKSGLEKHGCQLDSNSFLHLVFFLKKSLPVLDTNESHFCELSIPDSRETDHTVLVDFAKSHGKTNLYDTYLAIGDTTFWGYLLKHLCQFLLKETQGIHISPENIYDAYTQSLPLLNKNESTY